MCRAFGDNYLWGVYIMSRINNICFEWCDAWIRFAKGYRIFLKRPDDGRLYLKCFVNNQKQIIDITDIEDELIKAIEDSRVDELNGKRVFTHCADGYMWLLGIEYDDKEIKILGSNAYPPELLSFIDALSAKLHLEQADVVEKAKSYNEKYPYYEVEPLGESGISFVNQTMDLHNSAKL